MRNGPIMVSDLPLAVRGEGETSVRGEGETSVRVRLLTLLVDF